jgi:outer membrane protein assembly factor BamD (BamD/ComL family)
VDQRILIPGRVLTVNLDDRNLSIVGRATEVQVAVWTKNGDRETMLLLPYGDSQTKFQGTIMSHMAPVSVSNSMLEVYGGDEVYYDFTEDFRKRAKISAAPTTNVITVASDAEMYASSGAIVDKAELEKRALEEKIKASIAARNKKPVQEERTVGDVALSTVRLLDQVKPGNAINVRVVDSDQNVSPQKDTVAVRVKGTSGDAIDRVVLTETDAHSGVFEGVVKTDSSEAVAYATDSEEGKDPNFVISAGVHPAWTAEPNNARPKVFSVDMYDNVALNELSILANVPGRKLRKFILQTSLNGKDYTSVGSVPAMFEAWDGSPRFQVARFAAPASVGAAAASTAALGLPQLADTMREYLESGFAIAGVSMAYGRHANFNIAWDENVGGVGGRLGFGNDQGRGGYVARFVGGFYLPTRETKSFELTYSFTLPGGVVVALLDGQPLAASQTGGGGRGGAPDPSAPTTVVITKQLGKGVHRIEVFLSSRRDIKPTFELKMDSEQPPYVKPCPAEMFDIKASPEIAAELASKPVEIAADQEGSRFTAKFGEKSNARVLRLIMLDFETDAPAINRIQLTNRDGKQILPTRQNLIALRKNDILEIVPGDRVTVTYQDPVVVSRDRDVHQAFLTATFFNAVLSASFLEVAYQGSEAVETYVPLRRFAPSDVLTVFINDPDCDTSAAPDKVTFTMELFGKKPVEMEAMETKEHSGTFIGRLFPVTNAATKASEVQVVEGDDILLSYADRENTDPGIPWKRTYVVEQVWYQTPELRVFDVFSQDVPTNGPGARVAPAKPAAKEGGDKGNMATRLKAKASVGAAEGGEAAAAGAGEDVAEQFTAQREMVLKRPVLPDLAKPASVLINGSLIAEVMFPTIAKSPMSKTEVFIQTKAGRKKASPTKDDKPAAVETKTEAAPPATEAEGTPATTPPAAEDAAAAPPPAGETVNPPPADAAKPAVVADAAKPAAKPAAEPAKTEPKAETPAAVTEVKIETSFDISVPGTIKRVIGPGGASTFLAPPGYAAVRLVQPDLKDADDATMRRLRKSQTLTDPLGAGIFTLVIPLQLGDIPDAPALEADPDSGQLPPLYVHGDDDIYIGYRFADDKGKTNWLVQTVKLNGDKFFDVMDRSYQEKIERAYVGETLFFRVLDQMRDVSAERDEIKLDIKTSSGGTQKATLVETMKHTGVFKGAVKLTYAAEGVKTQDSAFASFAVKYGDTMDLAYARPPRNEEPILHNVVIHKGADGGILPFSKKFKDQEVAVQTQFTLAEAYFELAKRHRKMGQQDLARKEIAHGKRLLEEAIRDFPDVEFRVQADYLLANLALEFANDSLNADLARQYLLEAANKFADIVGKNPESPYAPKSQYKKGLVYEKMGEMDQAAEEYVKLSYKYPDNELVAETIARLGQYFLNKGTNQLAKAKEDKNPIESEKKRLEALETFTTAGQVLSRLAARFPAHQLAGKTQVLSGQCFMRAEKYMEAAKAFEIVIKKPENNPPDLVAEAMFWCGESYMKLLEANPSAAKVKGPKAVNPIMAAYKMYKQITWDYPASKWAKYARGRLADPKLAQAERTSR